MRTFTLLLVFVFFLLGGLGHFIYTDAFIKIMPSYLPRHWELVIVSGFFEILGACGLLVSKTRRWAGFGLIALSLAVLPANIHMALNPEQFTNIPLLALYLRLPLQFVLIWLIWWSTKPQH